VVTVDDATSAIYSAFLVEEEGTASSFRGLAEVVAAKGLFCALYTDRGSHYFHTPAAGGTVSRTQLTQVGRGARAARHRTHCRLFAGGPRPLGAGLPDTPGPAAEGIPAGRRYRHRCRQPLAGRDLHRRQQRPLRVPAEQNGSAFVADRTDAWGDILCIQEEHVVGNDNTVKWKRLCLQLPPSQLMPHFVRTRVRVHEYPDGRLAVFWGPHRLAAYDPQGTIIDAHARAA
jgi:hypothetical protein